MMLNSLRVWFLLAILMALRVSSWSLVDCLDVSGLQDSFGNKIYSSQVANQPGQIKSRPHEPTWAPKWWFSKGNGTPDFREI